MKRLAGIALPLFMWTGLGVAQSYCTRMFHSVVINDQTLYIDGGEIRNIYSNQSIIAEVPHELLTIDLSKSWANSDSDLFTRISKPYNASHPNDFPPILNEGASFSDGSNLYFYGGYISGALHPNIVPPVKTWKYNIAGNTWSSDGFKGWPVQRLCEGGTAQSTSNKKAYYLGGALNPGGDPRVYGTPGASPYSDSGLVVLDQDTLTWSNYSTTSMNKFGTFNDGYMNIIENIGDEGILVAFGGNTRPVAGGISLLAGLVHGNEKNSVQNISVYDIANQEWYTQESTGDVPNWRMSGCSVMAPAQDLSSFSIYVFGGIDNSTSTSDGNVYVLTLPSFRWIKLDGNNALRIKHKCQLAGEHQMIVVGGTVPTKDSEYEPTQANCDSDVFAQGVGIYDINQHQWAVNYSADDEKYTVHSKISDVIGGGKTGGATLTQPEKGWTNTDLGTLFQKKHTVSASSTATATPSSAATSSDRKSKSISGGGIAGATVGAVAGAAAIIGVAFFAILYRRRRAAKQNQTADMPPNERQWAELHGKDRPFELATESDATAEMPANSIKADSNLPPQELPADSTMYTPRN